MRSSGFETAPRFAPVRRHRETGSSSGAPCSVLSAQHPASPDCHQNQEIDPLSPIPLLQPPTIDRTEVPTSVGNWAQHQDRDAHETRGSLHCFACPLLY